jgi:hypothetical protein
LFFLIQIFFTAQRLELSVLGCNISASLLVPSPLWSLSSRLIPIRQKLFANCKLCNLQCFGGNSGFCIKMPEFIVVKCCDCDTWQVTQKCKPKGKLQVVKWTCKLCNKAQSVTNIASSSMQAAELRPIVQELNLRRKDVAPLPQVEEVRVPVRMSYSSEWDALVSSSSSSEDGESLPLFAEFTQVKRRRKSNSTTNVQNKKPNSITDQKQTVEAAPMFKEPTVPFRPSVAAQQEDGEDGMLFSRDSGKYEVVCDEEVWQEPDE